MAQHDYSIANQGFPAFRSDLNDALAAIVSNNSGATEPTTMFAHQIWVDTAANPSILKIRNADNDAWITIGSIDQTGDTFTLVNLRTSGPVVFNDAGADVDFRVEGDTEANLLFVDASADAVGIGTSSPDCIFGIGDVQSGTRFFFDRAAYADIFGGFNHLGDSGGFELYNINNSIDRSIRFSNGTSYAGRTEHVRIDSSGSLLVGTTSGNANIRMIVDGSAGVAKFTGDDLNHYQLALQSKSSSASTHFQVGFINAVGTVVGAITHNDTATSYVTSSDYRLKHDIQPMTGALAKVLELKPVTYTWKENGSVGEGFIAHELQEVAPYAVTGEKDGEQMQGVDYGKITPLLTAALQEAIAEIQLLKARVAELEAK
jgi:hypothetical protein